MKFAVRVVVLALCAAPAWAQVDLTGAPVQQNFDSLVNTGTGTTLPAGWSFLESSANTMYTATDGSANSGDTYSAGSTGSTDRALGSLSSNSNQIRFGAQLRNMTGSTLGTLTVSYVAEQWRLGDATAPVDQLDFQYSIDATSLADGTWTDLNSLDAISPVSAGTAGALDGNATANKVAVSGPINGLSVANNATFWVRWVDPNVTGADDLLAVDDVVFSTSGAIDFSPAVSSSVPANNATNVAAAANLTINFTESVTTNPGWFTLNCTPGGNITYAQTGTGASRTVDPDVVLTAGASCTGTVNGANVLDIDGTPDPMVGTFVFNFTIAPDLAPTVASTTPANNAGNVGPTSNILINFSEPVSTTGSWYAISCATTGTHTAVASGGPQNYTLNPDVDFGLLEQCTVTLTANLIVDQDGNPDPLGSNFSFVFTTAANAQNYYNGVDASSPTALRTTLHALIDDHTAFPYTATTTDVWDILEAADEDPTDNTKVLDVYRNRKYTKVTDRSGATGPLNYNREHTWPNSLGFNDLSGNDGNGRPYSPYVDCHMLYASASDYNSNRGNKPYDNCNAGCSENPTDVNGGNGGGTGVYPGNSNWVQGSDGNTGTYEVWGKRKGDVARAILYMDVRYEGGTAASGQAEPDLIVTNNRSLIQNTPSGQVPATGYMGVLDTLLAWHAADPPDVREVMRNEVVYSYQGNRNPFIDHPEYAACLFQNICTGGQPDNVFKNGFE